jgi:hypothetical protein
VGTIWFGLKLGVGIVIGMALIRFVWNQVIAHIDARTFTKRGCRFQHEGGSDGHPNGWMTRDPNSNDWILWDIDRNRTVRLSDEAPKSELWRPSSEGLAEFLSLAEEYNNWLETQCEPMKHS